MEVRTTTVPPAVDGTDGRQLQNPAPRRAFFAKAQPGETGAHQSRRLGTVPRLLAAHALVLCTALAAVGYASVEGVTGQGYSSLRSSLGEEVTEYQQAAAIRPSGQSVAQFDTSYLAQHPLAPGHQLVLAVNGQRVLGSPGTAGLTQIPQVSAWLRSPPSVTQLAQFRGPNQHLLMLASPIRIGNSTAGVLVATGSLASLDAEQGRLIALAAAESVLVLVVALVGAYFLLRRLLGTVASMTAAAEEISRGRLERRLDYRGPNDEVGRLAQTFDGMLARISSAFRAQRELVADVSHQLRTPITSIRGHLELLQRHPDGSPEETAATLAMVLEELDRTSALVDRMLLLGRSLEADFVRREPVDLRAFMGDLQASCRALAPRTWRLGPVPDIVLLIDEEKLRGALLNLADNAARATGDGSEIRIGVEVGTEVIFSVSDTGPGIEAGDQSRLFQRYARGQASRGGGTGLGLAIVRAVADAHGGRAELESRPGRGTTVRIILPLSAVAGPTEVEGDVP